jgi:flavin prenyltransferase
LLGKWNAQRIFKLVFTGASSMPYGIRLLEKLLASGNHVIPMCSQATQIVAQQEMRLTLSSHIKETEDFLSQRSKAKEGQLHVFEREEWFVPVVSGSSPATL